MKRSRLKSRPRDKGTDQEAAHAWFRAVVPHGAKCAVCGTHRALQGHHVIPQTVLRAEFPHGATKRLWSEPMEPGKITLVGGFFWFRAEPTDLTDPTMEHRPLQTLLWDVRNGIAVCETDHAHHTAATRKILASAIPQQAVQFASELRLGHRLGPRFYEHPTNQGGPRVRSD